MKWVAKKPKAKPNSRDSVVDKIAKIRGIQDVDRFLHPSEDELFDPYLIKNIEDASNRIIRAIAGKERIVVSYDPDADGLTSATIMRRYLSNYTDNVDYIYGERGDGHGIENMLKTKGLNPEKDAKRLVLNKQNMEKIKDCDLLILIDSSSNDTKVCKYISETLNKDVIIIDHHEIERDNPHVLMVNPQQEGCEYPNKQLSGAGVVFKVLQVMEDTLCGVDVWQYIDLVAVGMYADVMRVDVFENRYLITHGLRNVRNAGLVRILKGGKANLKKLKCSDIGFTIAPLINGTCRMDEIELAIDLLMADDDTDCKRLRLKMAKLNEKRKEIQKSLFESYSKSVDPSKKALVVLDDKASKGFNGIISQQLSDAYKRPAIVGRLHKGVASGSFRANGFDFKSFLQASGLLKEAMGHPSAGGFEIEEDKLDDLLQYIEDNLPELGEQEAYVLYDLEMDASEIHEYIEAVELFNHLTGNGFPKIIVRVNNISVQEAKCIGKTMETVKINTFNDMELIKFRVNENYASDLGVFDEIDAVGQLQMNEFYNFGLKKLVITPQVMLEDYQLN